MMALGPKVVSFKVNISISSELSKVVQNRQFISTLSLAVLVSVSASWSNLAWLGHEAKITASSR